MTTKKKIPAEGAGNKKTSPSQQATSTESKKTSSMRPICNPCNEDSDFFDHLRDAATLRNIARRFALEYENRPQEIKKNCYIECGKPTPRGKAEALFRIIAYHLDMNVADVRIYLCHYTTYYRNLLKFAAKIPCKNCKAKDATDIDTIVHERIADYLDTWTNSLQFATNTVLAEMDAHGEEYDNG